MKKLIVSVLSVLCGLSVPEIDAAEHIIPTDETYTHDGIDLGYDNLVQFRVDQNPDGIETKGFILFDVGAIWRFFKPLPKFESLTLAQQVERLTGTEYAYAETHPENMEPADKDLAEAQQDRARTIDKEEKSATERGKTLLGNNAPTWLLGTAAAGAGVLVAGASGNKAEDANGNKKITIKNAEGVIINEFGSGSGSQQNTAPSSFDSDI